MFSISSSSYQDYESIPTETLISEYHTPHTTFKTVIENHPMNNIQMEDLSVDYTQENKFFKGFLLALPVSALIWGFTILAIKSLFF